MLQYSKLLASRESWKLKAIERGEENREHRKAIRHYRQQISELKASNKALLKQVSTEEKKTDGSASCFTSFG